MKKLLSLLLLFVLVFACGDDDDSSSPEPTEQPPEVVAPKTEYQGPQTSDPAAAPVQNFVTIGNAAATGMGGLVGGLVGYTSGEPVQSGGTWTWTQVYGEYTYTITVTYSASAGWTWTFTIDGGEYDNWVQARGWTNADGTAGWWKFYELGSSAAVVSYEWEGDSDNGSASWYEGDFEAGGTLQFQMTWSTDGQCQTVTLTFPESEKLQITNCDDGSGELYYWEWNPDTLTWDLMFEAEWTSTGSGSYTDYSEDPPVIVTWG
jgi:hypothetical protein